MKKPYSIEQLRTAIEKMRADERFQSKKNELILQSSRLSRLAREVEEQTIAQENIAVELNRLFYALESLSKHVGIKNFLEFVGLATSDVTNDG